MNQENIQENQEDSVDFNAILVPHIEEGVPIPKNSHEALPSMNNEEEVMVRATTIKEMSDITGQQIAPDAKHRLDAEEVARDMITNPKKKQEFANYANETMAFLGGMVGTYNHMIVNDLADLKLYVVNKLVEIVQDEESNKKEQITALRSIGEVDGVDAFKKKTEVVHKMETMEEVEKELLSMLSELKQKALIKPKSETIDAEYTMSKKDVDKLQTEVKEYVGEYKVEPDARDETKTDE
jgi:hypothetical protein